jgi:hypothetical protein
VEVWIHIFLALALDRGELTASLPSYFIPMEKPTLETEQAPALILMLLGREKSLDTAMDQTPVSQLSSL